MRYSYVLLLLSGWSFFFLIPCLFPLRAQNALDPLQLEALQAFLSRDAAEAVLWLELETDTRAEIRFVNSDTFGYVRLGLPLGLLDTLIRFRKQMPYQDPTDPRALEQFTVRAYYLYRHLLQPVEQKMGPLPDSLILIPQGQLAALPFEALLETMPDSAERMDHWSFWGLKRAIRYAVDVPTLLQSDSFSLSVGHPYFVGILPPGRASAGKPNWDPYRYRREEVAEAAELFTNHTMVAAEQEAELQATMKEGEIIHVAQTFPLASSKNPPSLSLAAALLAAEKPKLVMLTACESAVAGPQTEEGLAHFARQMMDSGSTAIIGSLWQGGDMASKSMTRHFYEELIRGTDKATALAKSRQALLHQYGSAVAHPRFWAHLRLYGANQSFLIQERTPVWTWFWTLLLILVLGGIVWRRRC